MNISGFFRNYLLSKTSFVSASDWLMTGKVNFLKWRKFIFVWRKWVNVTLVNCKTSDRTFKVCETYWRSVDPWVRIGLYFEGAKMEHFKVLNSFVKCGRNKNEKVQNRLWFVFVNKCGFKDNCNLNQIQLAISNKYRGLHIRQIQLVQSLA